MLFFKKKSTKRNLKRKFRITLIKNRARMMDAVFQLSEGRIFSMRCRAACPQAALPYFLVILNGANLPAVNRPPNNPAPTLINML